MQRPITPPVEVGSDFQLVLPEAPASLTGPVKVWEQDVEILTYAPGRPDPNPMFLEKRVYQGSSGRVYPLPFIDRIATEPETRRWQAIHLENEYLRLMVLPEIGGRIHIGYDKVSGHDFFYRQNVIKPALVGLAGPWVSGGVEFNWPQHHRPATFMPVETEIEHHPDGSVTAWCSDHDPMLRMKGMHGIRLSPGRAVLELSVRLYNRTQFTQTFLWWANVATRVHERYQSFFPTDVRYVADHAKRAVTTFPQSDGVYYGVDYAKREREGVPAEEAPAMFGPDGSYPANDLSWYANIPVPTSYMVTGTREDFFGGYDHKADAGVVHVANHHVAPGKKQWTWGNQEFGYAWDRSLTDSDGPYIELMAGVYTDNQPDFAYLAPWETKTFLQHWYPIHGIGVPQAANVDAALSLRRSGSLLRVGISVTRRVDRARVVVSKHGVRLKEWTGSLAVETPLELTETSAGARGDEEFAVEVYAGDTLLLEYDRAKVVPAAAPAVAREPAMPEAMGSVEELYLTGLHLQQYRHATREPEPYWREALRRDPGESRTHNALGLWHMKRGEFEAAAGHFEEAIARLTSLNPNPYDGEAFYNLGLARRFLEQEERAYDAFYKATWNAAWRAPAYFALAELDCRRGDWNRALDHVTRSLKFEAENLNALNLLAFLEERRGDGAKARRTRERVLALDPLDVGARWNRGIAPANGQERLDLAFDLLRSGRRTEAEELLEASEMKAQDGSVPMLCGLLYLLGRERGQAQPRTGPKPTGGGSLDYCFPSRLEELVLLQRLVALCPGDAGVHALLGNLLYDRRRHEDAMAAWETAARLDPKGAMVWRNLGIARWNICHDAVGAKRAFEEAFRSKPADARVFYERDQLWKRLGESPERRLDALLQEPGLVSVRDDLSAELATLYNQLGRPAQALEVLEGRKFQPWEGGEGLVLGQYVRAHLLLGRGMLDRGEAAAAVCHFQSALAVPKNLSEAKHLLANQSDVFFLLGLAYKRASDRDNARSWLERAVRQRGDFQQMSVREISSMTYWTGLAMRQLGQESEARKLFQKIFDYSLALEATEPKIDYFATSLPTMLLFEEDLSLRNAADALYLRAQALLGLEQPGEAERLLREVLVRDANHTGAADLLSELSARKQSMEAS